MKKYFTITLLLLLSYISFSSISVIAVGGGTTDVSDVEATSSDVVALILYMLLALLFSFLCSIAEAVLLNITPSYIADLREKKPVYAKIVTEVRQTDVDKSLAAILTMNTIAHTVGAIGSGAKAAIVFGNEWFGVFSAVMTLFILFLSEIIPKTIGVVFWRRLVRPVITYIRILNKLLSPFIFVSIFITNLIAKDEKGEVFSRDEFIAMAGEGKKSGDLNEREFMIIQNLFRLASLTVREIYTPRTVIVSANEDDTVDQVLELEKSKNFSRIIIHESDLDKVTGFVLTDELMLTKGDGLGHTPVKELRRDLPTVPINYTLSKLLEDFLSLHNQIAIVVDEFGTTKGLVTIEDILETLLGMEIVDENDTIEDMRKLAKQIWKNRMQALGVNPEEEEDPKDKDIAKILDEIDVNPEEDEIQEELERSSQSDEFQESEKALDPEEVVNKSE